MIVIRGQVNSASTSSWASQHGNDPRRRRQSTGSQRRWWRQWQWHRRWKVLWSRASRQPDDIIWQPENLPASVMRRWKTLVDTSFSTFSSIQLSSRLSWEFVRWSWPVPTQRSFSVSICSRWQLRTNSARFTAASRVTTSQFITGQPTDACKPRSRER